MDGNNGQISFAPAELSGSRLRCLILTAGSTAQVAGRLSWLACPRGGVTPGGRVMPRGFVHPAEAVLGVTPDFLTETQRVELRRWWLAVERGANMPNWDIAATATVEGRVGLVLVEAKAHEAELDPGGKNPNSNAENHARIGQAIAEANAGLNAILPGWALSRDSHYQLSNRFAWAWKVTSLGVPVVLIYLGFLNADELAPGRRPFSTPQHWHDCLTHHAGGVVPAGAWERRLDVGGTPFWPLIRSTEYRFGSSTA